MAIPSNVFFKNWHNSSGVDEVCLQKMCLKQAQVKTSIRESEGID